jgi:hypothetical protein
MKKVLLAVASMLLLTTGMAFAEDGGLEIGLDYRFRMDSLKGIVPDYMAYTGNPLAPAPTSGYTVENKTVFMNRFGMHLKANPVEDVTMKARLDMYKVSGHQTSNPVMGQFFADHYVATNDGTVSHIPEDSIMRVDYAYATVSNIFGAPIWYSVGRRPSTGGIPSNIRQNNEKMGTAGIPSLMVNYAFDGMTLGVAPDIDALPGFYTKLCYGRGYDSGFQAKGSAGPKDTDFYGLNSALYDTDNLHVELQLQTGRNIFDAPSDAGVTANLGNINWLGGVVMGKVSSLNLFATAAASKTDANGKAAGSGPGLLNDPRLDGSVPTDNHKGYAVYVGGRYDIASTGTKLGVEYNHGSKNWISMVPAEDDLWTSKLGTRGDVYEIYIIQSLNRKAIAKKGEAFIRLGYQLYKFDYSNSNNWVGAPHKISDMSLTNGMLQEGLIPVEKAQDLFLTFDVRF